MSCFSSSQCPRATVPVTVAGRAPMADMEATAA